MMGPGKQEGLESNRKTITGTPGVHPIETGIGAAGGAVAGAMVGSVVGPIGTAVGGLFGAIIGGFAGREVGEVVNPTIDNDDWENYWRKAFLSEPYYCWGETYEDYAAAYRLGYTYRTEHADRGWEDAEQSLQAEWQRAKGDSRLKWETARLAIRAAWRRAEH